MAAEPNALDLFKSAIELKDNAYNTITEQIAGGVHKMTGAQILELLAAVSSVIEAQNRVIVTLFALTQDSKKE